MKSIQYLVVVAFLASGISCSRRNVAVSHSQTQRLHLYVNSENEYIAGMFGEAMPVGVQPAITQTELEILDALADRVDTAVRRGFDQKYTAWLNCWAPLDSMPVHNDDAMRQLLQCNGEEFQELIDFCRQQNDDVFLLLYQLAARATCPYDQLLLHPAHDLLANFPEFNRYWREVDLSLQKEKPDLKNRTCNEATIWYTRKILEIKGYTYANGLAGLFDGRKIGMR